MPTVHNKYKSTAPTDAVYIGRPTKWGKPFVIRTHGTREQVVQKYRDYILSNQSLLSQIEELRGKHVVCFCAPQQCHGDVLIELANQ